MFLSTAKGRLTGLTELMIFFLVEKILSSEVTGVPSIRRTPPTERHSISAGCWTRKPIMFWIPKLEVLEAYSFLLYLFFYCARAKTSSCHGAIKNLRFNSRWYPLSCPSISSSDNMLTIGQSALIFSAKPAVEKDGGFEFLGLYKREEISQSGS